MAIRYEVRKCSAGSLADAVERANKLGADGWRPWAYTTEGTNRVILLVRDAADAPPLSPAGTATRAAQ